MIAGLYFAVGATAGVAQAGLLARATRAAFDAVSMIVRISAVAAFLVVAVRAGQLTAAATGWAVGLSVTGALLVRRLE